MRAIAPANIDELARVLREAERDGEAVQPVGGATKLGWGHAIERRDVVVHTRALSRVLEHAWADMTVSVEAGCNFAVLQTELAKHGQRLALDPLWPERASVGGVLSTNDSGALRLRYGSARDLLIGMTLVLADGTVARSGGKVVKNVAGYDLPKLAIGAFGTLGVIAQAILRVHPLPEHARTLALAFADRREAQAFVLSALAAPLALSALQLRGSGRAACQVDVLIEGTRPGIDAQTATLAALAGSARVSEASAEAWQVRQGLWDRAPEQAIVKLSVLPSELGRTCEALAAAADGGEVSCVLQATGLGHARLALSRERLFGLREQIEARGGSLTLCARSQALASCDVFGSVPALRAMRALKQQFDPQRVLNPGVFVGGL